MLDWRTTVIDDPSLWPKEHLVPLDDSHADARGEIQSLVNFPVKNTSLITSKKGTVRSNHYHVTDWHYIYIISGLVDYYYRPTGSGQEPTKLVLVLPDLLQLLQMLQYCHQGSVFYQNYQ